jgi:hypothetical protein
MIVGVVSKELGHLMEQMGIIYMLLNGFWR